MTDLRCVHRGHTVFGIYRGFIRWSGPSRGRGEASRGKGGNPTFPGGAGRFAGGAPGEEFGWHRVPGLPAGWPARSALQRTTSAWQRCPTQRTGNRVDLGLRGYRKSAGHGRSRALPVERWGSSPQRRPRPRPRSSEEPAPHPSRRGPPALGRGSPHPGQSVWNRSDWSQVCTPGPTPSGINPIKVTARRRRLSGKPIPHSVPQEPR